MARYQIVNNDETENQQENTPKSSKGRYTYLGKEGEKPKVVDTFLGKMPTNFNDTKSPEFREQMTALVNEGIGGPGMSVVGRAVKGIPADVIPAAIEKLKQVPEFIKNASPTKNAKKLIQDVFPFKNTQEATNSITNDIREAHGMREAQALEHLNFPLQRAGSEKIYEFVDPLISSKMDKSKAMINRVKDLNVGELFNTFKESPTFQNAHNLKSELGHLIGDMKKIPGKSPAQNQELGNLVSVRNKLETDVKDFLKRRDLSSNENLLPQYEKGTELYRENVSHYLSDPKLRKIVREGRTSVPNIHKIFESPYDLVQKLGGETKPGPITKILADLPEKTKNAIMFRKIGGLKNAENPEALLKSIKDSEQLGYSHITGTDLKDKLLGLETSIKRKENLKKYGKRGVYGGSAATAVGAAPWIFNKLTQGY
jgi:hypothetical protein